ncbi:MAG: hypothetical protein Harvfovirus5_46 [Harvfovirus sp.]|uniref:Uncharacterized protein n=1 Tax=Harvfovirus sp. TaxID=2487768 RepID=A0A3G5A0P5_9VIRU|nr:MAG: hypothetical protein Harvfovirus5_46 [Harvfovirus sp.]
MKPTQQIGGFVFCENYRYPVYSKRCADCNEGMCGDKSILCMSSVEIEKFISLLPIVKTNQKCQCKISEKAILVTPFCGIRVDSSCYCRTLIIGDSLKNKSWSCPFCCAIVCGLFCFTWHFEQNHLSGGYELAVPDAAMGGEWCPLCREISIPGSKSSEANAQLYEKMVIHTIYRSFPTNLKDIVKNTLCKNCIDWDKKKLDIPVSLKSHFAGREFYPIETKIPRFLLLRPILPEEIFSVEVDIDKHAGFLTDILKQQYFSGYDSSPDLPLVMDLYASQVWRKILNSEADIKSISLPGAVFLANIRAEIALFDKAMEETKLLLVLQHIIRDYLGMQLWYFEAIMVKIQTDAIRFAPQVRVLLSHVVGKLTIPKIFMFA